MGGINKINHLLLPGLLFFLLCCLGIYQIKEKAGLPFITESTDDILVVSKVIGEAPLIKGDILLSINNHVFKSSEEVEVLLDGKKTGEQVKLQYLHSGLEASAKVTLINYYSALDLIIYSLSGLLFLFIGIITVIKAAPKKSVQLFFWGCVGAALIITMSTGSYVIFPAYIGFFTRFIFLLAYCITPVVFVHFILNFPREREDQTPKLLKAAYIFGLLLSLTLTVTFIQGVINNSTIQIQRFVWIYNNILRIFIIITFSYAIFRFAYSYRKTKIVSDKKRLKWILYGLIVGPFCYVLFWVIPYAIFGKGLLPEFIVIAMLGALPLTFAIAIVKYHFFDIDIIINRSVVYLIVLGSLISLYLVLFMVIGFFITGINETVPAVLSVAAVAIALQPVKIKVQSFVDRKFFKVQYNYREALRKFLNEIDNCIDIKTLAESIVKRTNQLIPVEKIGFFELQMPEDKIKLISQIHFEFLLKRSITFKRWELKNTLSKPIALIEDIEDGIDIEPADSRVFKRWGMALVFPFRSEQYEIFGFLVLGKKKSGFRFTLEDIDLLNAVSSKVATTMERNKYQKELVLEHVEKERLEELNKMKSFIVSRVSHDFRTPLQSISMFTELLRNNKNYSESTLEDYLKIIEGESNRLKLMAENVLDFSKIEKGIFEYSNEEINLNNLVNNVVKSMYYQLSMNKFTVKINLSGNDLKICADNIGIEAVLINLISNALKYSTNRKVIKISTGIKNKYVFVSIKDEGIGISQDDLNNIFHPFLRGHNIDSKKIKGAGLGLSIVKHIMDAHKGRIEVESEPGKGSCFTLLFPVS